MRRTETWAEDLDRFFAHAMTRPFVWGEWDCCLAACEAIHLMTLVDPAAPFRGTYRSAMGARHVCQSYCDGSLEAMATLVAAEAGLEEVPVARARRGDLALVRLPEGQRALFDVALGIVDLTGRRVGVPRHPAGMTFVPMPVGRPGQAEAGDGVGRAWKVGA